MRVFWSPPESHVGLFMALLLQSSQNCFFVICIVHVLHEDRCWISKDPPKRLGLHDHFSRVMNNECLVLPVSVDLT